jgi:uncharacterized protein
MAITRTCTRRSSAVFLPRDTMTCDWSPRAGAVCCASGGRCCTDAHPPVSAHCHEPLVAPGVPEDTSGWRRYRAVRARPGGTCVFCTGNKRPIHPVRPETCRAGPFTSRVKDQTIAIFIRHASPCPVLALPGEVPGAYGHRFALAKKRITHRVAHLTEDGPEAICAIGEPETTFVTGIPGEYHDDRN